MLSEISRRLLTWYRAAARRLPWRGSQDPYAVWVSEIMLQQTRVETVLPYYRRWMERFPTLQTLAAASEEDVLRLWEGLGYYSRARNLHKAARQLVETGGGQMPRDCAGLLRLPGVGAYTAGAIASMAFGADEATLDGNIRRVLARVFNLDLPAKSPEGERRLWAWARENLPAGQAGDYNQAWMDLGASICTPQRPACPVCPLAELCQAHRLGLETQRPIFAEKAPVPQLTVTAAVIARDGQVLIARRPPDGLLGGLWEFPGGKQEPGESLEACLEREICEEMGCQVAVGAEMGVFRHAYTHFKVILHAFQCRLALGEPQALQHNALAWATPAQLVDYPMGKIDRRIARQLREEGA